MARIRTIKPDFWEDDLIASLSLRARLLFIATWNFADDEGLLRWTAEYLSASAFMYDNLSAKQTTSLMSELQDAGLVFPYRGGRAQQYLGYIPRFLKHQRINRPQPSKLPPPSIQSPAVRSMYAERDGWLCQLCGGPINRVPLEDERWNLSLDHIIPQAAGRNDYPSNIQAAHCSCNKSKRDGTVTPSVTRSVNGAVNGDVSESPPEGKGRERNVSHLVETPDPAPQPVDDEIKAEAHKRAMKAGRAGRIRGPVAVYEAAIEADLRAEGWKPPDPDFLPGTGKLSGPSELPDWTPPPDTITKRHEPQEES